MEMSFCTLKNKDVINITDGKNLGNICDLMFDTCNGKILGIIVPTSKNFFSLFKSNNDIFIPYNRICKIGKDIILVDIIMQNEIIDNTCCTCNTEQNIKNNQNIQTILDNINKKY